MSPRWLMTCGMFCFRPVVDLAQIWRPRTYSEGEIMVCQITILPERHLV